MTKYVALLRGINVGGNSKVPMKTLKALFEGFGYKNVSTYINSGNVIFESSKSPATLTKEIEKGIEEKFGFTVRVLLRDSKNIHKLVKAIPKTWTNDTEERTDVIFLWDSFDDKKTIGLIAHKPDIDTLKYIDGAIVWNLKRVHYTESGMHKFIGTEVYKNMTARNVNTLRKLAALMN